jgi:hypothetical protein
MNGISTLFGREPAMVLALVQCVIVLGVSFGLRLTPEQTGAILALTAVVLGLITRTQVTPAAAPMLAQGTVVEVVTPPGQRNRVVVL